MCLLDPKTGASGSPVFPGHVRDPLRCFSGCAGKELRFEGCRSDVFVFVCAYLYLYWCICVFVFVFDHDYLLFWFIFDENPFLRLRLVLHEYLGVSRGTRPLLSDGASETLSEGIPVQLFDSPSRENCQIWPK